MRSPIHLHSFSPPLLSVSPHLPLPSHSPSTGLTLTLLPSSWPDLYRLTPRFLGTKWMMFLAIGIYALFVSTNYWERYYTLVPSAVAIGAAIVPLWASVGNYVTRYVPLSPKTPPQPKSSVPSLTPLPVLQTTPCSTVGVYEELRHQVPLNPLTAPLLYPKPLSGWVGRAQDRRLGGDGRGGDKRGGDGTGRAAK